jgi:hypothetical protein
MSKNNLPPELKQHFKHIKKYVHANRMIEATIDYSKTKVSLRKFMPVLPLLNIACAIAMTNSSDSIYCKIATSIGSTVIARGLILKDSNKILARLDAERNFNYLKIRSTDGV